MSYAAAALMRHTALAELCERNGATELAAAHARIARSLAARMIGRTC
jgi:hypothetical protein